MKLYEAYGYGAKLAKEHYEKYQKGEITKEQLAAACNFARINAAWGDEEAQEIGYNYLLQMEQLGFIKGLHIID